LTTIRLLSIVTTTVVFADRDRKKTQTWQYDVAILGGIRTELGLTISLETVPTAITIA
jgi:hypothetical protein